MIVSLACAENALVVVSEFDQVDSIALRVVGVHAFAPLQVIQRHTEVFAASDQVLAIV